MRPRRQERGRLVDSALAARSSGPFWRHEAARRRTRQRPPHLHAHSLRAPEEMVRARGNGAVARNETEIGFRPTAKAASYWVHQGENDEAPTEAPAAQRHPPAEQARPS